MSMKSEDYDHSLATRECECAYKYCCRLCWSKAVKDDPCLEYGCENPAGHSLPHGEFNNEQSIAISSEELQPK